MGTLNNVQVLSIHLFSTILFNETTGSGCEKCSWPNKAINRSTS